MIYSHNRLGQHSVCFVLQTRGRTLYRSRMLYKNREVEDVGLVGKEQRCSTIFAAEYGAAKMSIALTKTRSVLLAEI